jgi:hypothetical protein
MTGAIIGHRTLEIMTPETVQYSLQGQVATIRIDDAKRNAT